VSLNFMTWRFLTLVLASLLSASSRAQQTPPPSNPPSAASGAETQAPRAKSEEEKKIEKKEQSQRALGVLPQFGVTSRQNAPPLSSGEKFHLFVKSAFDPATIGTVGLQAGLSQAENEFPGYGQGAQGYGKRFGASLADEVSSGFWSNYFYPVLLKEDPRYFRLGEGSVGHRFIYGVKEEFVCHTDRGGRQFSFSNVLGAFTSGAISNLYYPGKTLTRVISATPTTPATPVYEDDRGLSLTLSRSVIALGYGMAGGLFDEFWPDIRRKISHKKNKEAAAEPGTASP
jgi:hypothetical protein